MCVTDAGAGQVARYDDLIEEAAGELERVERQVDAASQQLLDLQANMTQLARHTQHTDRTNLQVLEMGFASLVLFRQQPRT